MNPPSAREGAAAGGQTWSAGSYARNARFVSDLGAGVLEWLAPRAGERILDLGCGDGALTEKIAQAGAEVVGIDASANFVAAACARGLDVRSMDGHALTFSSEFDAVFSNAALHWMTRPGEVLAGVARALKPGGRFVAEFGGHGNVAAFVIAMRAIARIHGGDAALASPWYFPTAEEYSALLEEAGFRVRQIALIPRPTPLPTGLAGWLETFRAPFIDQYPAEKRAAVLADLEDLLRPLCDGAGQWTCDYVRLRVHAQLAR